MTLIETVSTLATLLWVCVLVLIVASVRLVGRCDRKEHVGHFVELVGVFVPGVSITVFAVLMGALLGLPQVVVALALLLPGAVALGLQLEVARLGPADMRTDVLRLTAAVALSALCLGVG
jgi:hypothetical protein